LAYPAAQESKEEKLMTTVTQSRLFGVELVFTKDERDVDWITAPILFPGSLEGNPGMAHEGVVVAMLIEAARVVHSVSGQSAAAAPKLMHGTCGLARLHVPYLIRAQVSVSRPFQVVAELWDDPKSQGSRKPLYTVTTLLDE